MIYGPRLQMSHMKRDSIIPDSVSSLVLHDSGNDIGSIMLSLYNLSLYRLSSYNHEIHSDKLYILSCGYLLYI